jgi:hypothetical protein
MVIRKKDIPDPNAELKELIQEAHTAIKDLRQAVREALQIQATIRNSTADDVHDVLEAAVAKGLEEFLEAQQAAIKDAERRVFNRFDRVMDTLLGEDKETKRKGEPSIPELFQMKNRAEAYSKDFQNLDLLGKDDK